MWAAGLCPKGDTCRFAHVTEDDLEEEELTSESDRREACPGTEDVETAPESNPPERHDNASHDEVIGIHNPNTMKLTARGKGTAGRSAQGISRKVNPVQHSSEHTY